MKDAALKLEEALSDLTFNDPVKKVWTNVTAEPLKSSSEAKELLVNR